MFTIPPSPPSAFATGGGASGPTTTPATLHLSGGVSPGRIPSPALIATCSSRRHDGRCRCVPRLLHGQSELFSLATGRVCAATGGMPLLSLIRRQCRRGIFDRLGRRRRRRVRIALVGAVRVVSRIFFVVYVGMCVVFVESSGRLLLIALHLGQEPKGRADSLRGRGRRGVRVRSSTRCARFQLIFHVWRRCLAVTRLATARPLRRSCRQVGRHQ